MRLERIVPWRCTIAAGDARNTWRERRGWLVVVEHAGVRGIGEASPLPGFAAAGEAAAMRFAVETAVLDALARARGVTLAELLVAAPAARVPINALVTDAESARAAVARGINTLKVKLGADDLARLAAIATAAPDARLRADANQSWPLADVPRLLSALASLPTALSDAPQARSRRAATTARLEYIEEPALGLARALRTPLAVPIALDESLADPDRDEWLDRALASGAVAALILKPTVLGGFAACAALARRARAHGVAAVVTHALEGPVGTAACAELARALAPSLAVGLDRHATLAAWNLAVPQLTAGAVIAPPAPGLGLDIDEVLTSVAVRPNSQIIPTGCDP